MALGYDRLGLDQAGKAFTYRITTCRGPCLPSVHELGTGTEEETGDPHSVTKFMHTYSQAVLGNCIRCLHSRFIDRWQQAAHCRGFITLSCSC